MGNKDLGVAACVLLASIIPAFAQDPTPVAAQDRDAGLTLSTGLDYSSGKYGGTQATNIKVALMDASYKTGNFLFSAALPYLSIDGPAYAVIGSNGTPVVINPKAGSSSTTRTGCGREVQRRDQSL